MKLLSLLRHATATADAADDHSRSLSVDGQAEAVDIAAHLAMTDLPAPDLILSSDSRRTHQTAKTLQMFFPEAALDLDHALYLAGSDTLLDIIHAQDDAHTHVVIVAHNPGIGQLAFDLGGGAHPAIARGFAPATLATFACDIHRWADLQAPHAVLKNVIEP